MERFVVLLAFVSCLGCTVAHQRGAVQTYDYCEVARQVAEEECWENHTDACLAVAAAEEVVCRTPLPPRAIVKITGLSETRLAVQVLDADCLQCNGVADRCVVIGKEFSWEYRDDIALPLNDYEDAQRSAGQRAGKLFVQAINEIVASLQ